MITVKQAAEQWNVTPRFVQMLCKNNKIPGAMQWGRTWMIPKASKYPYMENAGKISSFTLPKETPFLDMTDMYAVPGTADLCIEKLKDQPEAQNLFAAEIAYSRGEIDKVIAYANLFLKTQFGIYAINGRGMLLALAAMWKGDINLYRRAKLYICEAPALTDADRDINSLSLACIGNAVRDIYNYPEWFIRGQFQNLHHDAHPAARVFYIKFLLIYAQQIAIGEIVSSEVTGMSLMRLIPYIAEPLISCAVTEKTVIPEIYMRLLVAIAYHQTGDESSAIMHIDRAIELALPDMLLGILAEHRRNLDSLLEERVALASPEAYIKFCNLSKVLRVGWTKLHNSILSKSISTALTPRERECARLAAFGLSNNEIAHRMNLSLSTIKKTIFNAMNKTGVDKREALGAFV